MNNLFVKGATAFAAIPEWLLFNEEVTPSALRLWGIMYFKAFTGASLHVDQDVLAQWSGYNVRSVRRQLQNLVDAGALSVQPQWDGDRQIANIYVVNYLPIGGTKMSTRSERDKRGVIPGDTGWTKMSDNSSPIRIKERAGQVSDLDGYTESVPIDERIDDALLLKAWSTHEQYGLSHGWMDPRQPTIRRYGSPSDFNLPERNNASSTIS